MIENHKHMAALYIYGRGVKKLMGDLKRQKKTENRRLYKWRRIKEKWVEHVKKKGDKESMCIMTKKDKVHFKGSKW